MAKLQSTVMALGAVTLALALAPVSAKNTGQFAVSLTVVNVCQVGSFDAALSSASARPNVSCSVSQPYRIKQQNIPAEDPVIEFAAAHRLDAQGRQMWVVEF